MVETFLSTSSVESGGRELLNWSCHGGLTGKVLMARVKASLQVAQVPLTSYPYPTPKVPLHQDLQLILAT